ncbi:hypothetical protein PTTG_30721, partial [Puccinia triticina 1-1 BBBD Race 1]
MDDLVSFCQNWAKSHGYAVAKSRSNANKNVYIRCNRSGKFRGSIMNLSGRKTSTSKISCPFEVKGSIPTSKKIANKTWTLEIRHGGHNHQASSGPSSHTAHKKLLPEQILLQLQTSNNETYATNKTISNALQKICREDLDGRSPTEALLCILKESNWLVDVKVSPDTGAILSIFCAHPGSVHLARINHHVALMDSTYKTNKYDLPLLHVIGQAASNRSFTIAFCFMAHEDADSYLWS